MNYISAESVSKSFLEQPLFKDITLGISKGQKVALVGKNGSGKTTLLNILAGKLEPEGGNVVIRKDIKTAYLDQNPLADAKGTVEEIIYTGNSEIIKTIRDYEECVADPSKADKFNEVLERMESLNAWDFEQNAKQILTKLGIDNFSQQVESLSGGQKKRVALAKVLLEEPDLLILDEPTNHLDLESIEWLEQLLSTNNGTLLLVTHDRYFLDKVCNEIVELDNGNIYKYKGNYSYFLEKKSEREISEATEIGKAQQLMKKELEWMRRQPKARGTKSKSRVDAFYDIKDKASSGKTDAQMQLNVKVSRQGNKIIELEHISKSFGEKKIIKDFSYVFKKRDRIGIVGKNGTGKSTFLNMLTGKVQPDSGQIIKGETTVFGYYTQEITELKENARVIENVTEVAEFITMGNGQNLSASALLQHFLFTPARQYTPVYKLSGGEKKRLMLLRVLMKNPNFLILDEPTNDLDLTTLSVLEEFLENYGGCLLIVSHDRYFMDRLVEHLFVFEGDGTLRTFPGNYTDYRNEQEEMEADKSKPKAAPAAKPASDKQEKSTEDKSKKLNFNEKREYETLEKEIEELEKKKETLVQKLNSGNLPHEELTQLSLSIEDLIRTINSKSERWLELADRME